MRTFLFETPDGSILEVPALNIEQAENRLSKANVMNFTYKSNKNNTTPNYADYEYTKRKRAVNWKKYNDVKLTERAAKKKKSTLKNQ